MGNSSSSVGCSKRDKKRFKWRIDGFSSLLDKGEGWTYSRVFEIKGLNWHLNLYPIYKTSDGMEYVYLMLQLARTSLRSDTVVQAVFKFLIFDQSYGKRVEQQVTHHFETLSPCSATTYMIPLETLKDPSSGFLINDSCIFGVEFIKVVTVKTTDATSESLLVQSNTFNDRGMYTWIIEGFTTPQSPCTSPTFEIGGYEWSLTVSPSSLDLDGSSNFLSLFLELYRSDKLPQNSGILVEFSLSIKDQESGNHKKSKGRCQFAVKGRGWGYGKFISLENFGDSSKGYLVKGKCYIEAEIAIIGSSIMG